VAAFVVVVVGEEAADTVVEEGWGEALLSAVAATGVVLGLGAALGLLAGDGLA